MSTSKANCRKVEINVPQDLFDRLTVASTNSSQPRSHWICDAIQFRLDSGDAKLDRSNFPATVASVLKATNGKLSRIEAEHLTSLVIIGMSTNG